jgi:hypothetical protein
MNNLGEWGGILQLIIGFFLIIHKASLPSADKPETKFCEIFISYFANNFLFSEIL